MREQTRRAEWLVQEGLADDIGVTDDDPADVTQFDAKFLPIDYLISNALSAAVNGSE